LPPHSLLCKATLPGYYYDQTNAEDDVDSKLNVDANTVVPHFPASVNDGNNEADVSGANPTDCQELVNSLENPPTGRLGCFHFSLQETKACSA
jgi:hypothetical protein